MKNAYETRRDKRNKQKIQNQLALIRKEVGEKAAEEIETYLKEYDKINSTTKRNYVQMLGKIIRETKTPLSGLLKNGDNTTLRQFFKNQEEKGISESSLTTYKQALSSYFNHYKKWDRIIADKTTMENKWEKLTNNIKDYQHNSRRVKDRDLITPEIYEKILDACYNPRDKAIISMLWETGRRISEILGLRVKDIDFTELPASVNITVSKTKNAKKDTWINMSVPYVKQWLDFHPLKKESDFQDRPLWVNIEQNPKVLTKDAFYMSLSRICERAGLKIKVYNHLFRYSRVYHLYWEQGWDIKEIKEYVGHGDIKVTDGYLKVNEEKLKAKVGNTDIEDLQAKREKIQQAKEKENVLVCPNIHCGEVNPSDKTRCYKCNTYLSEKDLLNAKKREKDLSDEVKEIKKKLELVLKEK